MTLGQVEREVRATGAAVAAGAAQLGLLAIVDVLDEPGEAQDVLGHPLAPLPAGLRVGQRLVQRPGRGGQRGGDLGVAAQRGVDLTEALGAGVAEGGDQLAEAVELAAHLRAHRLEIGADDVLARIEACLETARGLVEMAAVEHVDVVQRRRHCGIALVAVAPVVELGDGDGEGPPRRRRHGEGDPGQGQEGHGHDGCDCDHVHVQEHDKGVSRRRGSPGRPRHRTRSAVADHEAAIVETTEGVGHIVEAEVGVEPRHRSLHASASAVDTRWTICRMPPSYTSYSAHVPGKSLTHPTSTLGTPPPARLARWRWVCPAV